MSVPIRRGRRGMGRAFLLAEGVARKKKWRGLTELPTSLLMSDINLLILQDFCKYTFQLNNRLVL